MKKQIEEMAKIMCRCCSHKCDDTSGCIVEDYAEAIYNEDYRKQSEGEWREDVIAFCNVCSSCRAMVDRSAIKCNSGKLHFCPNCGAKMKGATDEHHLNGYEVGRHRRLRDGAQCALHRVCGSASGSFKEEMTMATCKECIHYDICIFHIKDNENEKCPHFKIAADVVEVVRCKDCVHYANGGCNHFGYHTYTPDVDENDFCSYGERKK